MLNFVRNLMKDESGATAIEYGLIAALVAVGLIGALTTIGTELQSAFNAVAGALETANPN